MPIYEYKCDSCGRESEVLVQGFTHTQTLKCPDCGRDMGRRLSYPNLIKNKSSATGKTCCGRDERCETPACSTGGGCRIH